MQKKLSAVFIGTDGSKGYRHGLIYDLIFDTHANGMIDIARADGSGDCPYTNFTTFTDNWTAIKRLPDNHKMDPAGYSANDTLFEETTGGMTKHDNHCILKAADNEPLFVLRAQDITAPEVVGTWIKANANTAPSEKLRDALEVIIAMRAYKGGKKVAD